MAKNGLKKVGDWKKAALIAASLKRKFLAVQKEYLEKWAAEGPSIVIGHIQSQDLPWEQLNNEYRKSKAAEGKETDIYKSTRRLVESITGEVVKDGVFIGIRQGLRSEKGDDLTMIATVLEYGSRGRGIPARPLWQPSTEEIAAAWEKDPPIRDLSQII